jgi:hypothetical protein
LYVLAQSAFDHRDGGGQRRELGASPAHAALTDDSRIGSTARSRPFLVVEAEQIVGCLHRGADDLAVASLGAGLGFFANPGPVKTRPSSIGTGFGVFAVSGDFDREGGTAGGSMKKEYGQKSRGERHSTSM